MPNEQTVKDWQGHRGEIVASANGFDVIACEPCGFKHIVAIPSAEELARIYRHDYYLTEKPLYIERYLEDLDWWNLVYERRYEMLERHLPGGQRTLLDIGSGPGYFLLKGRQRGWRVKGIEPSTEAVAHSRGLDLDIEQGLFGEESAAKLGLFDAVTMSLVLEHIPYPGAFLRLIHRQLKPGGLICVVVPNDFNPFQLILRDQLGFEPWWVAPPHHINYFDFGSLQGLLEKTGFEVVHQEASFPIDLFLLMGDNYVGNDEMGRASHKRRMNFEKAVMASGSSKLLADLYESFAGQGLGREIVMFARKISS